MSARKLLAGAILLAACGHTEPHHAALAPPRPPTRAVELHTITLPARPFVEQGIVQILGWGTATDETTMLRELEKEAKRRGCDALVRVRLDQGAGEAQAIGVCVVWAP